MKQHFLTFLCFLCLTLFFSSCHLPTAMMTRETFSKIPIGASIEEVKELAGAPYDVIPGNTPGISNYRYLERIQTGPNQTTQEIYVLTVMNGQIILKEHQRGGRLLNLQGSNN